MDARDPFKDGNVNVDKNNSVLVYEIESFNTRKSIFTFSNIMLVVFFLWFLCVCVLFSPQQLESLSHSPVLFCQRRLIWKLPNKQKYQLMFFVWKILCKLTSDFTFKN